MTYLFSEGECKCIHADIQNTVHNIIYIILEYKTFFKRNSGGVHVTMNNTSASISCYKFSIVIKGSEVLLLSLTGGFNLKQERVETKQTLFPHQIFLWIYLGNRSDNNTAIPTILKQNIKSFLVPFTLVLWCSSKSPKQAMRFKGTRNQDVTACVCNSGLILNKVEFCGLNRTEKMSIWYASKLPSVW